MPDSPKQPRSSLADLFRRWSVGDWFLGCVLVVGFFVLLADVLPTTHQAIVAALLFLVLLVLLRRVWSRMTGPMFVYDLLRTARRGNSIGHRFLYGSFVLLAIFMLFTARYPVYSFSEIFAEVTISSKEELAKLAEGFFALFMCVQIAAVLVVTPAYTAGVVAEEKQRRTLEFILSTDLSNREVVLGLLGARLANLFLLLLTGLPVLSMLQFLGGIDPLLVFCGFIITALTVFSLGAQSILSSVYSRRPLDSIIATYFVAFFTELVPSIITLSALLGNAKDFSQPAYAAVLIFFCAFYHVSLALGSSVLAVTNLRSAYLGTEIDRMPPPQSIRRTRPLPPPPPRALPVVVVQENGATEQLEALPVVELAEPEAAATIPHEVESEPVRGWGPEPMPPTPPLPHQGGGSQHGASPPRPAFYDLPIRRRNPCGDDPMVWKELGRNLDLRFLLGREARLSGFTLAVLAAGIFLISLLLDRVAADSNMSDITNPLIATLSTIVASIALMLMALNTCSRISREREQQTLDNLLTTPLESGSILAAKCLAGFWALWPMTVVLAAVWGFGILTGGLHIAALPLVVGAYLIYSACLCTLGLWLSMLSRTTLRATLFTLLIAMLMVVGPGLLSRALESAPLRVRADAEVPDVHTLMLDHALTPPITLWTLGYGSASIQKTPYGILRVVAALCGVLFYAFLTVLMWMSMLRRLREVRG